jgi:CheY-like chemotaxis protein/signal transduction histidine kinase/CHASE3 domain sensor protein
MRPSIGKKIALGFMLALVALLVIGLFSSRELQDLEANSAWVDHTFQVQETLESLIADLSRSESSSRGYELAFDPGIRTDAEQAAARAKHDFENLRNLTQDNPVQQERLDKLEPVMIQRLDALQRLMDLAPSTGVVTDRTAIVREGEAYMSQVRELIHDMQEEENTLLKQRRAVVREVANWTYFSLVYGSVTAFVLVGVAGLFITGSITRPIRLLGLGAEKIGGGDYAHRVVVRSRDEVGQLAGHFNRMAEQVQERQLVLAEQDWLKTGLTRIGNLFQGERDPARVCHMVLSELASLLNARRSVLYVTGGNEEQIVLTLQASYAADEAPEEIAPGQGLVGQCYLDQKRISLEEIPADYFRIGSALGATTPRTILVQPALFEGAVMAVLELALLDKPTPIQLTLLERVSDSLGVVLNTIAASQRTEELLVRAQALSSELQVRQDELNRKNRELEAQTTRLRNSELLLQEQQEELKQTNEELEQTNEELQQTNEEIEEKANLLAAQKKEVEHTNREIEVARRALEEKAKQIAQTSKYKSEFLANMSHELRTPLNSLLILSKILAENHENNLTEKQVQYAGTIYSSGNDLLELINEVLDLSKIESGAVEIETDELPFTEVSRFVEQTFRPVAEDKHLEFHVDFDAELPKSIQTDTRRLEQILKNLLSNAFKFTETGSVHLRVAPAAGGWGRGNPILNQAPSVVSFAIKDTGIGIPREKQQLIFQAFQQADAGTSRKYGGTGLGLSISREIAGLLGGSLEVESKPGGGSTFTLFLPTIFTGRKTHEPGTQGLIPGPRPSLPATASTVVETDPEGIPDDRADLKPGDLILLIIEDDPAFAGILSDFAREKGFKAVVARSVAQGVALAAQIQPSAITLDIHLPDSDGWVVLDRLKHDPKTRHIPIHIISADEERERSLRLGAVSYFQKPVTKEIFDQALGQMIEFINRPLKNLLIVEDDRTQREALVELIGNGDVQSTAVSSAAEAFAELEKTHFDCLVLDLGLPDMGGLEFIREIHQKYGQGAPPIIVYTGRDLSRQEETELRMISDSIVIKNARSPERLLDETALFLHRVQTKLPEAKRRMLEQVQKNDSVLAGRKVLVVDDDVRNIFAITSALEASQMQVNYAESGQAGIDFLELHPEVEVVLMDVMMPDMDGFEAIRRIRANDRFKKLPIISVTAKAMKGDREKCLEAGASDYITKPVDMDQLRSLLRVWLYQ